MAIDKFKHSDRTITDFRSKLTGGGARSNLFEVSIPDFPTANNIGEREIESKQVGESVMRHLRKLDEVAFVRFASVYRSFQDPNEFSEEVKKLSDE